MFSIFAQFLSTSKSHHDISLLLTEKACSKADFLFFRSITVFCLCSIRSDDGCCSYFSTLIYFSTTYIFLHHLFHLFLHHLFLHQMFHLFLDHLTLLLSCRRLHCRGRRLVEGVQPVEDHDVSLVPGHIIRFHSKLL